MQNYAGRRLTADAHTLSPPPPTHTHTQARVTVVDMLKSKGLYRGVEDNAMRLGLSSRSKDVIEPVLKPQVCVCVCAFCACVCVCVVCVLVCI